MKTLCIAVLFCMMTGLGFAQTATTDVPKTISYQGMINAPDGTPVADGQYNITVSFYADANGVNRVWQGTYPATVTKGIFDLILGTGASPFRDSKMFDQPLWVGVKVGNGDEMRPLSQLSSAPSALGIADSSVTSSKMATPYVAGIAVNGAPITGVGSMVNLVGAGNTSLLYDQQTNSIIVNAGAATKSGDTANSTGSFKGNGASTEGLGNPVIDGAAGSAVNTLTMWSVVNPPGPPDQIVNSSVTDIGGVLATTDAVFNVVPAGSKYQINGSTVLTDPGANNIFAGVGAGTGLTTGTGNTATGENALKTNTTGTNNTALGFDADVAAVNLTNATAIGWNAKVNISNALVLGSGADVGIGTSAPGQPLEVKGNVLISSSGGAANQLQMQNPAGTFTSTFQAGAQTANLNYTLPIAVPAGASFLSNNGAGVLSWVAGGAVLSVTAVAPVTSTGGVNPVIGLTTSGTLAVAGGALGINLANSNTWTAAQTISTSGAGTVTDLTLANSVAPAVNSGAELDIQAKNASSTLKTVAAVSGTITTTTAGVENGSLFLSTINAGTLTTEATIDHGGSVTLAAYGKGIVHSSATGVLTSSNVVTGDITAGAANQFLVTNGGGAVAWTGLNTNATLVGNGIGAALGINLANPDVWTALETFANNLQIGNAATSGHVIAGGALLGPIPIIAANAAGGNVTDVAGLVTFTAHTATPGCGYLLYIPVAAAYLPPPTSVSVVVSGDSCTSEALFPYGKYVPANWLFAGSPPSIAIGVVNPPAIGDPYKFDYHVIEVH